VKGLEPIVVIFLEKRDKEAVWLKIREDENLYGTAPPFVSLN
jgi:hypothetical protein